MTLFCLALLFVTHISLIIHAVRVYDDLAAIINLLGLICLCYVAATL